MDGKVIGLLLIGFLLFIAGMGTVSEATMGPTLVGAACFIGIAARITQAEAHHTENIEIHDDDIEAEDDEP